MILIAGICLTILYIRFARGDRSGAVVKFSVLNLSAAEQRVYYPERSLPIALDEFERPDFRAGRMLTGVAVPEVVRENKGIRANVDKLIAALDVEFRLLRAERSLVVLVPLISFFSIVDVAFYKVVPEASYSATYASSTANALLLFLLGMTVFFTGEAMHRDRELKIEPVLWSAPIPNSVVLLSKYLSTILLTVSLIVGVGLMAIAVQLLRGPTKQQRLIVYDFAARCEAMALPRRN